METTTNETKITNSHIFTLFICLSTFLLLLKKYATHNNDILHIWLPSYNEDVYLVNYFSSYLDFG